MESLSQIPNELWLYILRGLSRDTLKALCLTSSIFKNLCRTFLFAHFNFHPYAVRDGATIVLPLAVVVNRALERLEFWTSDDIAPHVRLCKIIPWQCQSTPRWEKIGLVWSMTWDFFVTDSPYILIAPFFESLEKFTRLRSLHAEEIHFTQSAVASLCRAPAITDIQLVRCKVAVGEHIDTTSLCLGVSRFALCDLRIDEIGRLWIPLLRPECLRELRCNPRIFGGNVAAAPVFPLVHTLSTTVNFPDSTMSYVFSVLSKFPAVEILSMDISMINPEIQPHFPVPPSTVLPVLRQYTGPLEMMALFLPRSTLTHLVILRCNFNVLREELNMIQTSNILSLHVSLNDFDKESIGFIRPSFPRLKELHVRIFCQVQNRDSDVHHQIAAACIGLGDPSVLPIGLERMAFRRAIKYKGNVKRALAIDVPEFNNLRDALERDYPALTTFWFDGHNFLFQRRKSLDGVKEGVATIRADVKEMQRGFNAFWVKQ
ncbi:hypothetical protein C8R45DRAFT_1210775 [Mycena sanguinolenta]|nr:hypothetical protein C8R45DRAFT_1210775 [Mycena sanguinolenta]